MADESRRERPISPHLQIYRPQITSVTSIFTRITGNALLVGGLLVVWWLFAAANGPEAFALADGVLTSWIGDLVMTLSLWALWYHTLAGIRHLIWHTVTWMELPTAEMLGWGVIGGSLLLTLVTLLII